MLSIMAVVGAVVGDAAPIRVAVEIEAGGVGVNVPPPIIAVGSMVPSDMAVRSGDGVMEGISVGAGGMNMSLVETQPSRPSSRRIFNHSPVLSRPMICTPVPGFSAVKPL